MWCLAFDPEFGLLAMAGVSNVTCAMERTSDFEVRLAVQILRLDVAGTVIARGGENHYIRRNLLVIV